MVLYKRQDHCLKDRLQDSGRISSNALIFSCELIMDKCTSCCQLGILWKRDRSYHQSLDWKSETSATQICVVCGVFSHVDSFFPSIFVERRACVVRASGMRRVCVVPHFISMDWPYEHHVYDESVSFLFEQSVCENRKNELKWKRHCSLFLKQKNYNLSMLFSWRHEEQSDNDLHFSSHLFSAKC